GALIPIGTLAFSRYVLHLAGPLPDNAATILGIAVATVFRYAGYKLWVFTGSDGAENPPAGGSGDGDQGRHGEDHEAAIAVTQL
ncbi:MAG: GtrA family protein, partial [Micrococcales bacterium]|nr:GtrA family protein [Micrococcales bacterium]